MFSGLDEHSLAFVMIKDWVPALITVVVGGVLATLLFPQLQGRYAAQRSVADRRSELAGRAAVAFRRYVMSWRRLRGISDLGEDRELSKIEEKRQAEFVADRKAHKDELIEVLCYMKAGFSSELAAEIDRFIDWDEAQASLRSSDLPPLEQWVIWEKSLLTMANREAQQR